MFQNFRSDHKIVAALPLVRNIADVQPGFGMEKRIGVIEVAFKRAGVRAAVTETDAADILSNRETLQRKAPSQKRLGNRVNNPAKTHIRAALVTARYFAVHLFVQFRIRGRADVALEANDFALFRLALGPDEPSDPSPPSCSQGLNRHRRAIFSHAAPYTQK